MKEGSFVEMWFLNSESGFLVASKTVRGIKGRASIPLINRCVAVEDERKPLYWVVNPRACYLPDINDNRRICWVQIDSGE